VTGTPVLLAADADEAIRFAESAANPHATRIRAPYGASDELLGAAHRLGMVVDDAPLTGSGHTELPHWLLEQSVSRTMHRYGRLI
jgi:RHH-type proline utilization regulon transcriptional repressor/proline dehydrogenase/delta 1-pyrroline-5-carboxylate dehydrogenase